jgi:hypothetical protein
MVCSICDELISIEYYERDTVLCMEAYRKEELVRAINDQLVVLYDHILRSLAVP